MKSNSKLLRLSNIVRYFGNGRRSLLVLSAMNVDNACIEGYHSGLTRGPKTEALSLTPMHAYAVRAHI